MIETGSGGVGEPAPAKINLYLHVLGRRPDGYHQLDSLVAFADIGDELRVQPAADLSLDLDGPFAAGLAEEADNLVLKAARLLGAGRGARFALTKNLPVASGLGGGSADAAAALRALRRLWALDIDDAALSRLAFELGADVPVCLAGRAMFVGGAGETLSPAPGLPPAGVVLVNPGVPLATSRVFAARQGPFSTGARFDRSPRDAAALAALLAERRNDLEPAAAALVPAVAEILAALRASPGCRLARMSGSGASCFGLYDDRTAGETAATWLAERRRKWWIKPAGLAVSLELPGAIVSLRRGC